MGPRAQAAGRHAPRSAAGPSASTSRTATIAVWLRSPSLQPFLGDTFSHSFPPQPREPHRARFGQVSLPDRPYLEGEAVPFFWPRSVVTLSPVDPSQFSFDSPRRCRLVPVTKPLYLYDARFPNNLF